MEKDIQFTIQGWSTLEGAESIHDELQEYAITLGWTIQIQDPNFIVDPQNPDTPVPMVDNPVKYEQVIFYDKPMDGFWSWLKNHKAQIAYEQSLLNVSNDIDSLKSQVKVTSQ